MRRSCIAAPLLTLALLTLLLLPSVARAEDAVSVRAVQHREFPTVRVTVSTETETELARSDVRVLENGVPVEVENVRALGGSIGQVDAVLVIDTSNSMAGQRLQTALAAARAFVQNVPSSLPIGVVSFAADPTVHTAISGDRGAVEHAVDSVTATTSQGTALFDGVVRAAEMFDGPGQHNLVLLTDGRCRANPTGDGPCALEGTLDQAVAAAEAAGVNVFTFGLSESKSAIPTLAALAERTGGEHQVISLDELEAVYTGLAREFSNQFVVTYRSKAPYGVPVTVEVSLPSGSATTRFLSPGRNVLTGGEATRVGPGPSSPVTSNLGIAVVAALAFFAFLNLLVLVQDLRQQQRRRAQLRSRIAGQASEAWTGEGPDPSGGAWIPKQLTDFAERTAGRSRAAGGVRRRLGQAGWTLKMGEFLVLVALSGLAAGGAGYYFFGPIGLLLAMIGVASPVAWLSAAAQKRLTAIQAQLADILMVIASSLRAGHSFMQALDTAVKEIGEPGATEFGRTMSEIRLGRDVDEALDALVERLASRDLEWTVTAIKVQRKIGGNLAEVLEGVAGTIRERETLRRQVKVLSAEGRISSYVLTVLPVLLAVYLAYVNPDYLRTLTTTRPGVIMLSAAGGLLVVGYLWMQRIVRLDDV